VDPTITDLESVLPTTNFPGVERSIEMVLAITIITTIDLGNLHQLTDLEVDSTEVLINPIIGVELGTTAIRTII
jgi:hypothetical protein